MVRNEVEGGHPVRVLPGREPTPILVFALMKTRLPPAKAQRFVKHLRDALAIA